MIHVKEIGEGCTYTSICTREHIVSLYYRTTRYMFAKDGRVKALKALHMCSARSAQVWIRGAKIYQRGAPLQRTTSSDQKATAMS